jgi:hypothetical protein
VCSIPYQCHGHDHRVVLENVSGAVGALVLEMFTSHPTFLIILILTKSRITRASDVTVKVAARIVGPSFSLG